MSEDEHEYGYIPEKYDYLNHTAEAVDEIEVGAKVVSLDGSDNNLADKSELIDRLFKTFTEKFPEMSLSQRSHMTMIAYETFYMWANNMTLDEYQQADTTSFYRVDIVEGERPPGEVIYDG